jgi:succinate dehydrogenase / fumarate reductase iron-sulfur subunit
MKNRWPSITIAARNLRHVRRDDQRPAARTGRRDDDLPVAICRFHDGDTLVIEPWRANAFPLIRDLVVNRSAFDKIIQAGGFVSVNTGNAPDGNSMLVPRVDQEQAMDAAACIGCGACVAACKNASAMLFVSAKVSHLANLPQGRAERSKRVLNMIATMDDAGFGACTNTAECEAACPAKINLGNIALLNREYARALFCSKEG